MPVDGAADGAVDGAVDVEVLIVGAGMTGLYQLHRALEEGFTAEVVEAGGGVGGTWFWNRYPGCRFDSESYTYAYLFSQELFEEWAWSEHFAGQPEIERYLNHVVDRFDLRRRISFRTRVTSAVWDEAGACWVVTLAGEADPRRAGGGDGPRPAVSLRGGAEEDAPAVGGSVPRNAGGDDGSRSAVSLRGGAEEEAPAVGGSVPRNAGDGDAAGSDIQVNAGADPGRAPGAPRDAGVERVVRARFLVGATGVLSVPFYPDVPGREDFAGVSVHTGRWPEEAVDLAGKRVAVIGTGSSGVQIIPNIVGEVAALTVYQRTPNWCTPLNNAPITDEQQAELRAGFERMKEILDTSVAGFLHEPSGRAAFDDTAEERRTFFESMWNSPGFTKLSSNYVDLLLDPKANAEWCDFIAAKVRSIVTDPAVADQLIPDDHGFGEKRPPFVERYYETFNDPKVTLVDLKATPILRIVPEGIETADGEARAASQSGELVELDVIVWATGFDFGTGALLRMGIVGRDGVALADHWADGPTTFLGVATHGFPNLFFPGGPHAAAGNNPRYNGDQVDFVTDLLCVARERGATVVEPTEDAEERWTAMIDRAANQPPSFGKSSYFFGANVPGKPRRYLLNAGGRPKLFKEMDRVKATDWAAFDLAE
ncbi:MAG: NAD(P)/FAD-dependent oxidoreductase [Acidimicrobiales bacterium]|nr:NAD(P)/FAD-dependent oxidoreductase [Acidimicrobiales bacterium]